MARTACWLMVLLAGCGQATREGEPSAASETPSVDPAATSSENGDAQPGEPPQARAQRECVAALRAEVPEALSDLLQDLGYRQVLEDACEEQRAVSEGDEVGCDGLTASALRAGCRRRLAVRHGRPDACPRVLDLGRDPTCLAWATRAPARCAATVGTQSLLCRAPFEGNLELCRELGAERAPCEAAVARFGPLLEPREPRALPPVSGELLASYLSDRAAARPDAEPEAEQRVALDLGRGVYVSRAGCLATLVLSPERSGIASRSVRLSPFLLHVGPLRSTLRDETLQAADALQLGLQPAAGGARPLTMPTDAETAELDAELATTEGEIQVVELDPRRGGVVDLVVDVRIPAEGGAYRVRGLVHTFVRDVDPVPAECQAAPGLL